MPSQFFWLFAILTLAGAIAVISFQNPVSSALSMVASFAGLAGLFVGLDAFFIGVIQILVYAGAIMVLFIFIIMLLDLQLPVKKTISVTPLIGGISLALFFVIQLVGVLSSKADLEYTALNTKAAAASFAKDSPTIAQALSNGKLPDVHLIGHTLFTQYNFPFQILGVLLLVSTIGVVVLSKNQSEPKQNS